MCFHYSPFHSQGYWSVARHSKWRSLNSSLGSSSHTTKGEVVNIHTSSTREVVYLLAKGEQDSIFVDP